jgi:O-succinylbenzoate synthase
VNPGGSTAPDGRVEAAPHPVTVAEGVDLVAVVRIPLRVRFRGLLAREVAVLRGTRGWAEFAPFEEYSDTEAGTWWAAAVEAAAGDWPQPVREAVPVNATVPAVPAADVAAVMSQFPGTTTAKVKVAQPGQDLDQDRDRVAAVRDALGPSGAIRVDANGAWSLPEALDCVPLLDRAAGGLQYVEQPCRSVDDLAAVRRRTSVRVAADESIRRAADPWEVVRRQAADVVVLKVAPLGGVRACLTLAAELEGHGLDVVVSSAIDSSLGLAAGVACAAALPTLPYACGLATAGLLADDVTDEPLLAQEGTVTVGTPAVSQAALQRLAVAPSRRSWWEARIRRVVEVSSG